MDPPEHNARLKARLGAGYEILSDERGELLDALNIRHARRSATGKDVAIPTQYLVRRDGVVFGYGIAHDREPQAATQGVGCFSPAASGVKLASWA